MTDAIGHFWPYEQRFELTTRDSLVELPDTVWHKVAHNAGTRIVKEARTPECRHFVLSLSSLFVFSQRIVLISCAPQGAWLAGERLLNDLDAYGPTYATLERRLPLGLGKRRFGREVDNCEDQEWPPVWGVSEAAMLHRWDLGERGPDGAIVSPETKLTQPNTSTLVILMHDVAGACDLLDAKTALSTHFPTFKTLGHQFDRSGFSFNAVSGESYLTMHYTGGLYASLECSLRDWRALDGFLSEILTLCRPEIVAPLWHGQPLLDVGMGNSNRPAV